MNYSIIYVIKGEKRMEKISAVYKITNTVTGDFYIGSSKNVKQRWASHKTPSNWNRCPNNPLYQDMQKYGLENFAFEILAEVEEDSLKEIEQQFIERLKPTYNNINAKGLDIERYKEAHRKANRKYLKSDKGKEYQKEYNKTDKRKKARKEYENQLCFFNGETLTLCALKARFMKQGIDHPTLEAKKYLIKD